MINLKSKQRELEIIKTSLDSLVETLKHPGFYFTFNTQIIPSFNIKVEETCDECLGKLTFPQFLCYSDPE